MTPVLPDVRISPEVRIFEILEMLTFVLKKKKNFFFFLYLVCAVTHFQDLQNIFSYLSQTRIFKESTVKRK